MLSADFKSDFLKSAQRRTVGVGQNCFPAFSLRIARVHPEKTGGKKLGFVAAHARPDFHDNVAIGHGIGRSKLVFNVVDQVHSPFLKLGQFLFGDFFHFRVLLLLIRFFNVGNRFIDYFQFFAQADNPAQTIVFFQKFLIFSGILNNRRVLEQALHFIVPFLDFFQIFSHKYFKTKNLP